DRQFVRNMNAIADATGGKAIVNRPELAEAIVDTMRATQRSYELDFEVPAEQLDGSYHDLRVRIRQHGLTLIYNHGYFAQVSRRCSPDEQFDNPEVGISARVSIEPDAMLLLEVRRVGEIFLHAMGARAALWQLSITDANSGAVLATATGNGLQLDVSVKVPGR